MSRIVVAAGAAVLIGVSWNLIDAMQDAQRPGASGGGRPRASDVAVSDEVPVGLLMGWTIRSSKVEKGTHTVVVDGAATLDRDEVVSRLISEGCREPEVRTSGHWEVRCPRVGDLQRVVFEQGDHAGEAVLTWVEAPAP